MRYVIYGAGGVGGVVGAGLAGAGYEVVLVARGAHLTAIQRDGLRVRRPDGEQVHRLQAVAHPREVNWQPDDVALLAMKSMDTTDALAALAAAAGPATPVVCVQNGVNNEREALRFFEHVYGVCVMLPASHLQPGVVVASSAPVPGILDIGRYPAGVDPTAERIAGALRAAGFESLPRPDIMRWKYRKLLRNLGNAVEAVCARTEGMAELAQRITDEGEAVLRAAGIGCASDDEDRERRADILRIRPVAGQPRLGGSSWQSLARRTGSIESDYLNGEVVLLGRLYGVDTPLNEHARQLANRSARLGLAPGSVDPDQFLATLATG